MTNRKELKAELETLILDGKTRTMREIADDFFGNDLIEIGLVDKAIQRLRKRGAVKMTRDGRRILWQATPSQALAQAAE